MADNVKCPKCGKGFKTGRGVPAHVKTCKGAAEDAKPRRATVPAPAKARRHKPRRASAKRRATIAALGASLNGSAVAVRLLALKGELEEKAAVLGNMAEDLASL